MTTQTIAATQAPQVAAALFEFLDETHQRLQQELAQMNRVVEAFVQDRMTAADAEQLADTARWFDQVARQHHLDEEKHVFPALLASDDEQVVEVTRRLRQDHGWIEQNWLEMGPHLLAVAGGNHWVEPAQVLEMVRLFSQLCLDHLRLEESLAYPEARTRIGVFDLVAADREMATRRQQTAARMERRH